MQYCSVVCGSIPGNYLENEIAAVAKPDCVAFKIIHFFIVYCVEQRNTNLGI